MTEFQKRLRALRENQKPVRSMVITSQLMGLSPSALGKYERGENEPGRAALALIADYYGVSVDYLVNGTK